MKTFRELNSGVQAGCLLGAVSLAGGAGSLVWGRLADGVWLWQSHSDRVPADGPLIAVFSLGLLLFLSLFLMCGGKIDSGGDGGGWGGGIDGSGESGGN